MKDCTHAGEAAALTSHGCEAGSTSPLWSHLAVGWGEASQPIKLGKVNVVTPCGAPVSVPDP